MSTINLFSGGLDVQSIVDSLIYVEREPIRRMESQTTRLQSRLTAFQTLNTKVSTLLSNADQILYRGETAPLSPVYSFQDRLSTSIFGARKTSSSNEDLLSATASKGAATGRYSIQVTNLASGRTVATDNFANTSTTTGTGTLVFQVGSGDPVTVTIDQTNNTLEGVRRAINAAKAGVTATIVNDGTASPYRLLVTSNETGTAASFTVTDNLTGGQALNLVEKQAAEDAALNINGVDIVSGSNTVSDAIGGITLNLKGTTSGPVDLTVDTDFDAIIKGLKDLVTAYNDVNSFANSQFKYDSKNKTGGVLAGDSTLRSTQAKLRSIFSQAVENEYTSYRILAQVGIKFNNDGSLSVDESKLRDALVDDITSVAALFLGEGSEGTDDQVTATDARVTYSGKTASTQAGTYDVAVTALAERAAGVGSEIIGSLAQAENLTVTYGGTPVVINLQAGDTLAAILDRINTAFAANGIAAVAEDDGSGRLRIATTAYGSSESITIVSDVASGPGSTGFGTSSVTDSGADIQGTINGNAATGAGTVLTGAGGQPEAGLSLTIAQTVTGSYGSVTFAPGIAGDEGSSILVNLRTALKNISDPLSGPIHYSTDSLNKTIKSLSDRIESYEDRLEVRRELLTEEFSRADQALRLLGVTQTSLNSQINSLSGLS